MLIAVHARAAFGTKANVTYSQLARISRPSTIYTYIPNSCGRIFGLTPFGINCKMSKNSFKQIFYVDKSIYLYLCDSYGSRTHLSIGSLNPIANHYAGVQDIYR